MEKKNQLNRFLVICIIAVSLLIIALFASTVLYSLFSANTNSTDTTFLITENTDFEITFNRLKEEKIIKNGQTFYVVSKIMQFNTSKKGKYQIAANSNNLELIRMLRKGQHRPVKFTFNNLRTADQLVERVGSRFMFEPEQLLALLHDENFIATYGFDHYTLPSMFIPNTYEIYFDITAEEFVKKMYGFYEKFWTPQRQELAAEIGLTPVEVCTLASIVEAESQNSKEYSTIAGLYINRLHRNMLLQSDPTVKFALGDFALKRILNKHLEADSPYNTYKYQGLPPGPIAIPSPKTMDAVLHYEHHHYIYMCGKEDFSGSHYFTDSYAEHAANAAKYHAALNKRQIK
ncbi:MAG: endolytic transglycosylase MltG [Bacteroidales bacterium]|jgi:UPF0755 protein|nr:endolytic transglycosylase MltG [Bacteroidales bacterium]